MIDMGYKCGTSAHFGGGLSMVECLTTLYNNILSYDLKTLDGMIGTDLFLAKDMESLDFMQLYIFLASLGRMRLIRFSKMRVNL